jgi:hypothetical protein
MTRAKAIRTINVYILVAVFFYSAAFLVTTLVIR